MLPNASLWERFDLHGWFGFWYSQPFSEREIEQLIGKGQQKRNSINQKTTQQKGKVNAALNDEMTSAAEALDGRTGKAQNQFRLLKFRLAGPGKHWNVRGTGSKVSIFIILAHLTNWNAGEGEKGEKKRLQSKNKIKKGKLSDPGTVSILLSVWTFRFESVSFPVPVSMFECNACGFFQFPFFPIRPTGQNDRGLFVCDQPYWQSFVRSNHSPLTREAGHQWSGSLTLCQKSGLQQD